MKLGGQLTILSRWRAAAPRTSRIGHYLDCSRSTFYAVLTSIPLLALYELLVWLGGNSQAQVRNAGDVWLRHLLEALGLASRYAFLAMLLTLVLAAPLLRQSNLPLKKRYLLWLLVESFGYSLALGVVINLMLGVLHLWLPQAVSLAIPVLAAGGSGGFSTGNLAQNMGQALGAGLFEEFVFRVLLVGGLLALGGMLLRPWLAAAVAILGSAVLFALAHHMGSLGEPFAWDAFLFRFTAGLLFSLLYHLRGFSVVSLTHALYDLRVMLL